MTAINSIKTLTRLWLDYNIAQNSNQTQGCQMSTIAYPLVNQMTAINCSVIQRTGSYFWSLCFWSSDRKCSSTQTTYCSCHSLVSDSIWSISGINTSNWQLLNCMQAQVSSKLHGLVWVINPLQAQGSSIFYRSTQDSSIFYCTA